MDLLHALAQQLDRARIEVHAIAPPPELASLSLAEAYEVQDSLVALRVANGARCSGWKLGITSAVKQLVMGIDHPLFGRLFSDAECAGSRVPHAGFIAPRVEPELAFGLAAPLDASMDARACVEAIAWVAPALEITDSRYGAGSRTAQELVSDNTSSAGYVVGERFQVRRLPPLDSFATALLRNGVGVMSGSTADVLGNPVNALAALAAYLAKRGLRAEAGEVVLSGAITDAIPVAAGDVVEARLEGLGVACVTFG